MPLVTAVAIVLPVKSSSHVALLVVIVIPVSGEIVAVTGKKKCGKTFFSSILMTLSQRRECMSMMRIEDECLSVLWIDTEQSEESTQEILVERIMKMIGSPDAGQTDRVEDSDEYEPRNQKPFNASAQEHSRCRCQLALSQGTEAHGRFQRCGIGVQILHPF